ncbi:hypothetical protein AURDEDRAFT_162482 [Auricularia subglabra TFB-10046 SS5]|nr:hypothetical protein AURDEDRAFT_162482 [Auricularia subglabra TFB-10046 SS5]
MSSGRLSPTQPTKSPPRDSSRVSWQDSGPPFKEGELLDFAHTTGWLSGLVRHRLYHRFEDNNVSMTVDDDTRTRHLEVLHLTSLGEPLRQCRTLEQILSVAYDLVQTHLELLKRGIIHCDLSWFNVICKPRHHPVTNDMKPEVVTIPYIEQIFGNPTGNPVGLLTDLDHAALTDVVWSPEYSPRKERTGTAMFIAFELSSETPIGYDGRKLRFTKILSRFEASEKRFRVVLAKESKRDQNEDDSTSTDPAEMHRAHHDAQSVYWILLWCFSRALPKGRIAFEPKTAPTAKLTQFCENMLSHTVGNEQIRPTYLNVSRGGVETLHPDLQHFASMFSAMATYLCIPWHIYLAAGDVGPDHAHHALRRVLLLEIISLHNEAKKFNAELDTTQPRIYAGIPQHDRPNIPYLKSSSHVLKGSGSSQTGSKRKADQREPEVPPEDVANDAPSAKKESTTLRGCASSAGATDSKVSMMVYSRLCKLSS